MEKENNSAWLKRVEEIIDVLEGSTVGELQLSEGATEITIRRNPHMVVTAAPGQVLAHAGAPVAAGRAPKQDTAVPVTAPLTGVYYSAASPSTPAFVNVGDVIQVGQIVALIEAMKVFNEIASEVSGRVVEMVAENGNVVQKGEALLKVEPL